MNDPIVGNKVHLLPGVLRPLAAFGALYLIVSALLRVALWTHLGRDADISLVAGAGALVTGVLNDAVTLLYLLMPFTAYLVLLPRRWHASRPGTALLFLVFLAATFGLLYLTAIEYFFFDEFNARFNLVAFDYLMYPTEVFSDIRDSYPVGTVMALALAAAGLIVYAIRRPLLASRCIDTPLKARSRLLLAHAALVLLAIVGFQTRLLTWSHNRELNEIAINGISSFFQAMRTSEIDYYAYYRSDTSAKSFARIAAHLAKGGGQLTQTAQGLLTRRFPGRPDGLGRLNVVVISEESFGAEFSGAYGAKLSSTPQLDDLTSRSLMFVNAFASGTRTVRGLEAITASFPPTPSVSILRRPGNEHIATWGSVMRALGYHTSFLYGGYGYFDNMNYFYQQNDFAVVDRKQIDKPVFANIWGVSDEDLFRKALDYFDSLHATGQPFFSIVMTTSNHKPFTFREGVPGIPSKGGGRLAGVRYADFALGQFLAAAATHPWFDDTLFVVVADHGARVYGKTEIPMRTYRIPLVLYSPKHLPPRKVETLAGQIDIAPTVLGLLGLPYEAPFFGEDALSTSDTQRIAVFNHNYDVALYRDGTLAVLGLNKTLQTLHYDAGSDSYTTVPDDPALSELAIAYYQTAYDLFKAHKYK